jgi:hypothetical protein
MANWSVGFLMGLLTVLAWQKVMTEPERLHCEQVRAEVLVDMYQRGRRDALSTSMPISLELEQACISVWANKQ